MKNHRNSFFPFLLQVEVTLFKQGKIRYLLNILKTVVKTTLFYATLIFSAMISLQVNAELHVIADLGGESALRYYEPLQPIIDDTSPPPPIPPELKEADLLPIVSHFMTPGRVEARQFNLPGMLPIFLIGDDEISRNWLSANRSKLLQMHATGMVVHISDMVALEQLRNIASPLLLVPVSADDLAQRLHLQHYPVIIDHQGLYQ